MALMATRGNICVLERTKVSAKDSVTFIDASKSQISSVCIRDLEKLNLLVWWFGFRLEPIFVTAPAASKIPNAKKWSKVTQK